MHRRFARPSRFNPFTVPGLLFAADDGGGGGGGDDKGGDGADDGDKGGTDDKGGDAGDKGGTDGDAGEDKTDWKAESRKHERDAKANRAAAKELAALKAKDQTDAERVTAERDTSNAKLKTAIRRAVTAEVKSAASVLKFQDPGDALRMLDLDDLTDDEGEVDDAAVLKALKGIAASKPYLLAGPGMSGKSGDQIGGGGGDGGGEKTTDDYFKEFNKSK